MTIRTYSELITIPTFEERFEYLQLNGMVGEDTFGHRRYLNQIFYKTREWRDLRHYVIVRDNGCDLGVEGFDIHGTIEIHHMNPITIEDIENRSEFLLDPEYLISTSPITHKAISYGDKSLLPLPPVERFRNDTIPWRVR